MRKFLPRLIPMLMKNMVGDGAGVCLGHKGEVGCFEVVGMFYQVCYCVYYLFCGLFYLCAPPCKSIMGMM